MAKCDADTKARLRVARFLGEGTAVVRAAADKRKALLEKEGGAIAVARETVEAMARDGLVAASGGRLALSPAGTAVLKRAAATGDPFQAQHRELEEIRIETPDGLHTALANLAESPLGLLSRRKARDGKPFLAEAEWHGRAAACRLRARPDHAGWARTGRRRWRRDGATAARAGSPT